MIYEVRCLNLSILDSWFRHVHIAQHSTHLLRTTHNRVHSLARSLFPINEFNLLERTPISFNESLWFSGDWLVNNEIEFHATKRMKTYPTPCQMWLELMLYHSNASITPKSQCPIQFVSFKLAFFLRFQDNFIETKKKEEVKKYGLRHVIRLVPIKNHKSTSKLEFGFVAADRYIYFSFSFDIVDLNFKLRCYLFSDINIRNLFRFILFIIYHNFVVIQSRKNVFLYENRLLIWITRPICPNVWRESSQKANNKQNWMAMKCKSHPNTHPFKLFMFVGTLRSRESTVSFAHWLMLMRLSR